MKQASVSSTDQGGGKRRGVTAARLGSGALFVRHPIAALFPFPCSGWTIILADCCGNMEETIMRAYVLAILTAVFFVLPTSAFSQMDFEVGPGVSTSGPGTAITMMATIEVTATAEEHGVESCGRPASTKKN